MTPWKTLSRGTTALFLAVAILLAATLFTVKARVQDVADRVDALGAAIEAEQRAIHVLRAEWSHLANPGRLRDLAARHLALAPLRPDQLVSLAALPAVAAVPPPSPIHLPADADHRSGSLALARSPQP